MAWDGESEKGVEEWWCWERKPITARDPHPWQQAQDRVLAGCIHLLSQGCCRKPHSQQLERRDSGIEKLSDWTWP